MCKSHRQGSPFLVTPCCGMIGSLQAPSPCGSRDGHRVQVQLKCK